MRILFLYSEYVNYLDGLMRCLVKDQGATVRVVSWDRNLLKPSNIPDIAGVTFQKRSDLSTEQLVELIESYQPNLVYISGWMDPQYLVAVDKAHNRHSFITVCGFDDNWLGTLRQKLGAAYFRLYLRKYFDRAWVAGARQYYYAQRLGYTDDDIVFNLLSCDTGKFASPFKRSQHRPRDQRTFFYVGNFRYVKGTDLLAEAFEMYRSEFSGKCDLVCIGQGPMQDKLEGQNGITVLPYMTSFDLVAAAKSFDIFVFPSRRDQWGVALHEFAMLGFPLLSSSGAGATERFLIDGYNGLKFVSGDAKSLAKKLKEFEEMPLDILETFGHRSQELGATITSELSAASLASLARSTHRKQ